MKFLYSLFGTIGLASVASANTLGGMDGLLLMGADSAPVYINAVGDVVPPQKFHWGSYAVKELDSAKPRKCTHREDFGRLGKRQVRHDAHSCD